jgi:Transglycosylase SLT domain
MRMNLKSIGLGTALMAAGGSMAAAGASSLRGAPPVAKAIPLSTSTEVRLPGAVVVARKPTISEIVDIILSDSPPGARVATNGGTEEDRVASMLRVRTADRNLANRIASALVSEGKRSNIGTTLLVGILLTENPDLEPGATSPAGARGLMQVMPFHAGKWGCPSGDLFNVESNICHGVRILADELRHSRNLPSALQRYNGCVHGTNTPDCGLYASRVYRLARHSAVGPNEKVTAATPFAFGP